MTTRKVVERVTARVFCHGPGGGNPVTAFASELPLSSSTQQALAKDCAWESVMVATVATTTATATLDADIAEMAFYMPSGEAVSFCAHAAMGGAYAVASSSLPFSRQRRLSLSDDDFPFRGSMTAGEIQSVQFLHDENSSEDNDDDDNNNNNNFVAAAAAGAAAAVTTARLRMTTAIFEEAPVSHSPSLARLLRGHCGILAESLVPRSGGKRYPTFCNASVAQRPKTLVHMNSLDALHGANAPKVKVVLSDDETSTTTTTTTTTTSTTTSGRNSFATACGSIDDSTGIYLYANKDDNDEQGAWECRQFPRASGYPEDPATGIAAAALAGSLYRQGTYLPVYKMYQGTAMGRPSLIEVLNFNLLQGTQATFDLQGRIEIDSRETIEVDD